jgi:hypothetical protein
MAASLITLMMEAAGTYEMSVDFHQTTWHYKPEGSHLHENTFQEEVQIVRNSATVRRGQRFSASVNYM